MSVGCRCPLCRRHERVAYIMRLLRRAGAEPEAAWLDVMFDHLLETEAELEMLSDGYPSAAKPTVTVKVPALEAGVA